MAGTSWLLAAVGAVARDTDAARVGAAAVVVGQVEEGDERQAVRKGQRAREHERGAAVLVQEGIRYRTGRGAGRGSRRALSLVLPTLNNVNK